jgi:hypothetical protein
METGDHVCCKNLMMDKVPKKKTVSVYISYAMFFPFDFFEVETDILSSNIGVNTVGCIILNKSADLK